MDKYTGWTLLELVNHYNLLKDGIELRLYRFGSWAHKSASDERDVLEKHVEEMRKELKVIEKFFRDTGIA